MFSGRVCRDGLTVDIGFEGMSGPKKGVSLRAVLHNARNVTLSWPCLEHMMFMKYRLRWYHVVLSLHNNALKRCDVLMILADCVLTSFAQTHRFSTSSQLPRLSSHSCPAFVPAVLRPAPLIAHSDAMPDFQLPLLDCTLLFTTKFAKVFRGFACPLNALLLSDKPVELTMSELLAGWVRIGDTLG